MNNKRNNRDIKWPNCHNYYQLITKTNIREQKFYRVSCKNLMKEPNLSRKKYLFCEFEGKKWTFERMGEKESTEEGQGI